LFEELPEGGTVTEHDNPSAETTGTAGGRSSETEPAASTQPKRLHRGLLVLGTLLITLSAVTPASSVFIIAPGVITQAGTGAFLSFAAAGVVGVFMAFVYAELSSAFPLTGGEYAIVGRTLGRLPGFMVMVLILVTQLLILAVIALGVGTYLEVVFPGLPGPVVAAAVCLLAAAAAVLDIKVNAWLTGIFLAIEMLALGCCACSGSCTRTARWVSCSVIRWSPRAVGCTRPGSGPSPPRPPWPCSPTTATAARSTSARRPGTRTATSPGPSCGRC
jgi:amino acid permease